MIDVQSESLIAFRNVPKWCQEKLGNRVSPSTVHRWRLRGVRGVTLESILVGGVRHTSVQALGRFFAASTAAADGTANTDHSDSESKVRGQADAYLDAEGI